MVNAMHAEYNPYWPDWLWMMVYQLWAPPFKGDIANQEPIVMTWAGVVVCLKGLWYEEWPVTAGHVWTGEENIEEDSTAALEIALRRKVTRVAVWLDRDQGRCGLHISACPQSALPRHPLSQCGMNHLWRWKASPFLNLLKMGMFVPWYIC